MRWLDHDMTETWIALHTAIGDQSRRGSQKVSGSRSAPINLNTDVDALKGAIVEWLVAAAARLAEPLNIDDPRPLNNTDRERARIVVACCRIVVPHIEKLIDLPADDVVVWLPAAETEYPGESVPYTTPAGGKAYRTNTRVSHYTGLQIAHQLTDLRRKARALLAITTPNDKLSLPCPHCNECELVRGHRTINLVNGKTKEVDQIDCSACGLSWRYERYQHLCQIWVKEDEMEREKLQKQLDTEKKRRALAEWLLAKREWQLSLALDCTDVTAADFAKTILADTATPAAEKYISDRDVTSLVGVSDSTVRSWATRGQITRHTAEDGSTRYLAREVWEHAKTTSGGHASTVRRLTNGRKAATA